ncbi:MAG: helix-turn-helix domain-containing protein [Actinobacteria bacterium]|nr:helix-turn-helix domain-containing protein [Actinomycetota bacterium]
MVSSRRIRINREALIALRRKSALSVTELATKAKLSHGTVIDLESGRRQGSAKTIRALAQALGVHPDALIANPVESEPEAVA